MLFKKTILIMCCTVILTFNLTMSYAKANSAVAQFEEWAAATYAGVVTGTMAVATGAMHAEQYLMDNVDAMYQTAKDSWKTMAPDMKKNFLSSIDQMADGIVTVGDWITGALDALKPNFGDNTDTGTSIGGVNYISASGKGHAMLSVQNAITSSLLLTYTDSSNAKSRASSSFEILLTSGTFGDKNSYARIYVNGSNKESINLGELSDAEYGVLSEAASKVKTPAGMISFGATIGARISLEYRDGTVVSPGTGSSTYNRLDDWIRERAIPNGQLGVYNPGAQAYTQDGYRLGLSTDGQTLLQLPDGIPWEGVADWKQPLLNTVDGTTAVLDTAVGSWINVATGAKIRDATVGEIAKALGVSTAIAEGVLSRAKVEEKAREQGGTGTTTGSLKNPTKSIVWTPLIMAGTAMTTKFPFSLPWDLIKQLKIFDVSPKAPKFDVNVPEYLQIDGLSIPFAFTLDLSMFDKVAVVVRWFNIIIWDIALILILRRLLPE
ncbi:hypothetical protein ACFTQ7_24630 [Lysinibacillus sp. NPDC056959]|uniref:hypothetical protein n=1 Tax=Lysinibacillus sp. NPDC056959 TaxID=3345981 RepID=UPI00362E7D96